MSSHASSELLLPTWINQLSLDKGSALLIFPHVASMVRGHGSRVCFTQQHKLRFLCLYMRAATER